MLQLHALHALHPSLEGGEFEPVCLKGKWTVFFAAIFLGRPENE
jgi:hypothetical protein